MLLRGPLGAHFDMLIANFEMHCGTSGTAALRKWCVDTSIPP